MTRSGSYEVVVPAYGVERTIAETLESIEAQSLAPARILVADDESPDGSAGVAARYRVEILTFPHSGLSGVQNRALEHVRAPLVVFVDADDVWHPDAGRELVAILEASGAGAASLGAENFWDGKPAFADTSPRVWAACEYDRLLRGNTLLKSGTMYRTDALRGVSGWREDLPICGDHDVALRLMEAGHAIYRTDWLGAGWRQAPTSMSRQPGPTLSQQLEVALPRLSSDDGTARRYSRTLWLRTLARAAHDRRDLRDVPKLAELVADPPAGQRALDTLVHSPLQRGIAAAWRAWRSR